MAAFRSILAVAGLAAGLAQAQLPSVVTANVTALDFGAYSAGMTSPAREVVLANNAPFVTGIARIVTTDPQFTATHDCGTSLAPGASCTVRVTFRPDTPAGPLNTTQAETGRLEVHSTDLLAAHLMVALSGVAEKSFVTHFYWSILGRAPDAGGHAYWSTEVARLQAAGANINGVWLALAWSLLRSPEYLSQSASMSDTLDDLYRAFLDRDAEAHGRDYWLNVYMSVGMPFESVITAFAFSTEFASVSQGVFGIPTSRPEADLVMDFYRAVLKRLPDAEGMSYWTNIFRLPQCSPGVSIEIAAEHLSATFFNAAEYTSRGVSSSQFVNDLYSAILRRAPDMLGFPAWNNQLVQGTMTREPMRRQFLASAEFQGRLQSVLTAGCLLIPHESY